MCSRWACLSIRVNSTLDVVFESSTDEGEELLGRTGTRSFHDPCLAYSTPNASECFNWFAACSRPYSYCTRTYHTRTGQGVTVLRSIVARCTKVGSQRDSPTAQAPCEERERIESLLGGSGVGTTLRTVSSALAFSPVQRRPAIVDSGHTRWNQHPHNLPCKAAGDCRDGLLIPKDGDPRCRLVACSWDLVSSA